MDKDKVIHGFVCKWCKNVWDTSDEAEKCYDSHVFLTIEYVWGGIGSGEMPLECIVKKHTKGVIKKIATYTKQEEKEVNIRDK